MQCLSISLFCFFSFHYTVVYSGASTYAQCTFKSMTISNTQCISHSMVWMTAVPLCRMPPVSACLLITTASTLGSVLDLVKHTFICLQGVSSDTLLCQHMVCPRVLNSSHAQMLNAHSLSPFSPFAFSPKKIHQQEKWP